MVSGQRLLFLAAEPRELRGLLRHCRKVEALDWAVDWARTAELTGNRIVMVTNGAGPKRAAQAVDAAVSGQAIQAVIHTGFCGALEPGLGVGDIFVATSIQANGAAFPLARPQCARPHTRGVLASVGRVARTAADKQALRERGAAAVEMEAAGVAERTRVHGLGLYCVRSVTDLWNETLQNDFQAALRADGHFDTMQILRSAMRRPAARIPELFRLRRRCVLAAINLGDFLADCRF